MMVVIRAIEVTSSTGSEAATSTSWLVATTITSVAAAATITVSLIATATSSTEAAASLGSLLHSFFLLSRVFSEPSIIVKNSFVEAPLFSQVGDSELMLLASVANILLES